MNTFRLSAQNSAGLGNLDNLYHPARIEIDLAQFAQNIKAIQKFVGHAHVCLVLKANAYGHGLVPMAKAAAEAGAQTIAVSCLQEAYWLRQAGVATPILVLGAVHEQQMADLLELEVEITVASSLKASLLAEACRKAKKKCRVHLKVDTGLNRTGVRPKTALELIAQLKNHPYFELVGIYSHLASATSETDPIALQQIHRFQELIDHPLIRDRPLIRHLANSGGTVFFPKSHLDMVRPGLLAYGYAPEQAPKPLQSIAPCLSLKARVSYFKTVAAGEGISYGHTYKTARQTRIATIPVGYGDGYRRALSNRGAALIRGKKYPIAGAVCMDQFMVDLGEGEAYIGDEVVLIGKQGAEEIRLEEIAALSDTIPHEILCGFNERIPRWYTA